jgi:hypothetical protein
MNRRIDTKRGVVDHESLAAPVVLFLYGHWHTEQRPALAFG